MPFASFNLTNPRTNPWNFHKKFLRIGGVGKSAFFKSVILIFFFSKKKKNLGFSNPNNLGFHASYNFFENFDDYPGFQPKISHTKHFSRQCTKRLPYFYKIIIRKVWLDSILSNHTNVECCQIESKQIFVGPADSKLNSKLHVLHMHKKQCPEGASTAAVFATNFA